MAQKALAIAAVYFAIAFAFDYYPKEGFAKEAWLMGAALSIGLSLGFFSVWLGNKIDRRRGLR